MTTGRTRSSSARPSHSPRRSLLRATKRRDTALLEIEPSLGVAASIGASRGIGHPFRAAQRDTILFHHRTEHCLFGTDAQPEEGTLYIANNAGNGKRELNLDILGYDADCPNVTVTRSLLIKAFAKTGVSARWCEWERSAQESPAHVHAFGSPTILVNGKDIVDAGPGNAAASCRIYSDGNGHFARTPPFELICSALLKGASTRLPGISKGWGQTMLASFPAIGTALLPKLVCPLCLPAYTALLGALGLGFVNYTPYLLPVTVILLALAIGVLAVQTRRSGYWLPLMMGLAAAAVIIFGKFLADLTWLTTAGIVLLILAIVMTMRKKIAPTAPCPACASAGANHSLRRIKEGLCLQLGKLKSSARYAKTRSF